jgi:hypothetical protein
MGGVCVSDSKFLSVCRTIGASSCAQIHAAAAADKFIVSRTDSGCCCFSYLTKGSVGETDYQPTCAAAAAAAAAAAVLWLILMIAVNRNKWPRCFWNALTHPSGRTTTTTTSASEQVKQQQQPPGSKRKWAATVVQGYQAKKRFALLHMGRVIQKNR